MSISTTTDRARASLNMVNLMKMFSGKVKPLLTLNYLKFRQINRTKNGVKWRCTKNRIF